MKTWGGEGVTLYKRDLNAIKMTSPDGAVTYSPLNSLSLNAGTFLILRLYTA